MVTATREEKPQSEVSNSVSVADAKEISFVSPAHPAELLNRKAGVYINNLGGEGHMTSIRQPISTGGVYLYLEDGIPTRPTGLFNHNALYEINVPQAHRIEVIKGPGSALYGSDSIGGIINVITERSPDAPELTINPEVGSYGWTRLLVSGGDRVNPDHGYRLKLNLTDNEGYRDESDYSRYAFTARLDSVLSDYVEAKTVLSYSQIEQSGVSSLEEDDYENSPEKNRFHNDLGRRELDALRLSSEFSYEPDSDRLYTITPLFRDNQMQLMPSWMLTYDPNDRDYQFQSFGLLAKYRQKQPASNTEWIVGVDIDYTPSTYKEVRLSTTLVGDIYTTANPTGRTNYDFDADQISVSPYIHGEWQATPSMRITAGLRYDYFNVDYSDNLASDVPQQQRGRGGFTHFRPESQDVSYDHFSPKLGLIYRLSESRDLYANYRHSFRVPSIGQLFRSGSTWDTAELDPVQTDSFELGVRGQWSEAFSYDATIYHMIVKDDIVRYIDSVDDVRRTTNAGETEHQGVELGLEGHFSPQWQLNVSLSYSNQEYKDYSAIFGFPPTEINYAGNDVGKAPSTTGNVSLQFHPSAWPGLQFELELEHLGDYYTDETNTQEYDGHDLLNFRFSHAINETFQWYGRFTNIADERYSTYTSNQVGDPDVQYRPGNPRSVYVGIRATL